MGFYTLSNTGMRTRLLVRHILVNPVQDLDDGILDGAYFLKGEDEIQLGQRPTISRVALVSKNSLEKNDAKTQNRRR